MDDVTKNLFYWFRGPSDDAPTSQRQLENNLTKSLVTILEHCDREVVLGAFSKRLRLRSRGDVVFSLQRTPTIAGMARERVILCVTGGETQLARTPCRTDSGRPDAWICGDGWTVLVEAKVGCQIASGQVKAHARTAGWQRGTYRMLSVSWRELHRMFKGVLPRIPKGDAVSRLLLGEWLAYMEHQNMAEFERLEPVDFDFQTLPHDERRVLLPCVRARTRAFAEHLAKTSSARKVARLYEQRSIDQWKFAEPSSSSIRGCWFNVGGKPASHTWHLTVFYGPQGLNVSVLGSERHLARELGAAGVGGFRRILEMARKTESVVVGCRRAWYADAASPYKGQKIGKVDEPLLVEVHTLHEDSLDELAVTFRKTFEALRPDRRWRTELHIRKQLYREDLLPLPLKKQVALVANALESLYPILRYLLES